MTNWLEAFWKWRNNVWGFPIKGECVQPTADVQAGSWASKREILPVKMGEKSLQRSTTRGAGSYVNFTASYLKTRQNHDLNCLFWGMWPEECLGLPLGLSDFTESYLPAAPPPAAAHPHVPKSAATKMECNRINAWNNFLKYDFQKAKKGWIYYFQLPSGFRSTNVNCCVQELP